MVISGGIPMATNPRYANGNFRRKMRARLKAIGAECHICHGKLGPIHYDEPSDYAHPLSFVIDEIIPVSRYAEFGYPSKEAVCMDTTNLAAAHYCCNSAKSNKLPGDKKITRARQMIVRDGDW
jgi:hypothetical protein